MTWKARDMEGTFGRVFRLLSLLRKSRHGHLRSTYEAPTKPNTRLEMWETKPQSGGGSVIYDLRLADFVFFFLPFSSRMTWKARDMNMGFSAGLVRV
jgi:hypothetical protein